MRNFKLIKDWVRGLQQKAVPQTKGVLHDDLGFCCLGYACHLKDPNVWIPDNTGFTNLGCFSYMGRKYDLPDELAIELGLSKDEEEELQTLNDGGRNFPKIAEYLKKKVYIDINFEEV